MPGSGSCYQACYRHHLALQEAISASCPGGEFRCSDSVHWGLCSELIFLGEADVQFLTDSGLRNDPLVGLVPFGMFVKTPKENMV